MHAHFDISETAALRGPIVGLLMELPITLRTLLGKLLGKLLALSSQNAI